MSGYNGGLNLSDRTMAEESMHEVVVAKLAASKGEWPAIARQAGVPYHTLTKVAQGKTKNPQVHTVQALYSFFSARTVGASEICR